MSEPKTVPEVLRAAADRIERTGWRADSIWSGFNDPCCAWHAIDDIAGNPLKPDRDGIYRHALDVLIAQIGHEPVLPFDAAEVIGDWNDSQESAAPVLAALRAAADASERAP